jgi:hypothetical protein
MAISNEQQLGRAKNAVLEFLENRITVPKIYIDATWDGHQVDVLAIDREGAGDVHAIQLVSIDFSISTETVINGLTTAIEPVLDQLLLVPAQYKYIAVVDVTRQGQDPLPGLPHPVVDKSFSPDGIGRVGFLKISIGLGDPRVEIVFKPERFRAKVAKLADEYIQQHTPDWELRA